MLHTLSINTARPVRDALSGVKRIEKTLQRAQSPVLAEAVCQLLRDWTYLFR